MQARKWIFSSPKVIEVIPTEEHATEIAINSSQDLITKTLGTSWNSNGDVFTATASEASPEFPTRKQNFLRKVAKIFVLLGFVCPYLLLWPRSCSRSCGCEATPGIMKFKMK